MSDKPVTVQCPPCNCPACAACPKCPDCGLPTASTGTDARVLVLPENNTGGSSFISLTNPMFLIVLVAAAYFFLFYTEMGQVIYARFFGSGSPGYSY